MSGRRASLVVYVAVVLAVAAVSGLSRPCAAAPGQIEIIRGTVEKWRPGILVLTDVKLHDGTDAARPVMIIVNKDTEYYDGPMRATKESITKGLKVLVKCEPAGNGRIGVLVRIVGKKTE